MEKIKDSSELYTALSIATKISEIFGASVEPWSDIFRRHTWQNEELTYESYLYGISLRKAAYTSKLDISTIIETIESVLYDGIPVDDMYEGPLDRPPLQFDFVIEFPYIREEIEQLIKDVKQGMVIDFIPDGLPYLCVRTKR